MEVGKKTEKWFCSFIGGKPTPASGATKWKKGDIIWNGYRFEVKATARAFYLFKPNTIEALSRRCGGEVPALVIIFLPDKLIRVIVNCADIDIKGKAHKCKDKFKLFRSEQWKKIKIGLRHYSIMSWTFFLQEIKKRQKTHG